MADLCNICKGTGVDRTAEALSALGAVLSLRCDCQSECIDHWHCDPKMAAHICDAPDRTRPCPTCGEQPAPRAAADDLMARAFGPRR